MTLLFLCFDRTYPHRRIIRNEHFIFNRPSRQDILSHNGYCYRRMTIEKTIYKESHFIYMDSIKPYEPQIGDIVNYDPETCQITAFGQNIRHVFGLGQDNQHIDIPGIDLGNICYRSEDVREYNVSLNGEGIIPGPLSSISGENGVKFTRDNQFVVKFVQTKKFIYGNYDKQKIEDQIRSDISRYTSGWYGLVYGRLKCERADLCIGNKDDCVFNVASNAEILKGWKVRGTCSFLGKKNVSMEVTQRPDALIGVYMFPFKIGSKKDSMFRPCEPSIKSYSEVYYTRGFEKDTPPSIIQDNLSNLLDVQFDQEEFDRVNKDL